MQVTELESEGLKKNLRIVVDAAEINAQTEAELRVAGERVKIPGFRPGYIPMKILQQRYGKSVQADVLKQVINRSTTDALAQGKLRPALTPQVNIEEYKDGGDLSFTVSFELFPEIPEMAFEDISLKRAVFEISEDDVDEAVKRVTERNPRLVRKEGGQAEIGDVLSIDFKGTINGVAFEGGSASNFRLELGSKRFIDGFEEQLIGAREGDDKIINVTFPEDYPGKEVAGKDAAFAVKIREIFGKEEQKPGEEFAKAHGFADMTALREALRGELTREHDQIVRSKLKKELFDILDERANFATPPGMVELEFNSIWERIKAAKERGEETDDGRSEDELRKEYQAIATRRVKLGLLLADVATRQKIQVGRDELGRAMMRQASQFPGQEKQLMEFYRSHPEHLEELRGPILEEKAVDFILSKIKFDDYKVTPAELAGADDDEDAPKPKEKKPAAKKAKKKEAAE